jgi:hypothetical protein
MLEVVGNVGGGVWHSIWQAAGREREGARLQMAPIPPWPFFPALHLRVARLQRLGLPMSALLEPGPPLLGLLVGLVRLTHPLAHSTGIALDQLMDNMENIRHTEALHSLFRSLY